MVNPVKAAAAMARGKGVGDFTSSDLSSAYSGGLSRVAYLLAQVMWHHDESRCCQLEITVYRKLCGMAAKNGWKTPRGKERLRDVARLVIREVVHPPQCGGCNGYGKVHYTTDAGHIDSKDCEECGGSGKVGMSARSRASYASMTLSNWQETWQRRYVETIYPWLRDRQEEAFIHMKRRMRE